MWRCSYSRTVRPVDDLKRRCRALAAAFPIALLSVFVLASGSCGSDPGYAAVLIRWRIFDGLAGTAASRQQGPGGCNGSYCCVSVYNGHEADRTDVAIDRLRLRVERIEGGIIVGDQDCPSCCFGCYPYEHTTHFEIPPGTYKLSLEAFSCGEQVGSTPVPLVRTLHQNDVINMYAQEIRLLPRDVLKDPRDTQSGARCPNGSPQIPDCPAITKLPALDASVSADLQSPDLQSSDLQSGDLQSGADLQSGD